MGYNPLTNVAETKKKSMNFGDLPWPNFCNAWNKELYNELDHLTLEVAPLVYETPIEVITNLLVHSCSLLKFYSLT